uniref:Uncharacterized protein n=1 Tax=Musa acuminata subsp. malaccensis TaxID=214687 RepID=A0A804I6X1_MUSAM
MAGDLRAQSLKEERKRNHYCAHDGHCFRNVELFSDPSCHRNVRLHRFDAHCVAFNTSRWFHTVGSDHEKFDVLEAFTCQATSFCSQKQAWFFSSFRRFLFYERLHLLALEFLESTDLPSPRGPISRKQCFCLIPSHFKMYQTVVLYCIAVVKHQWLLFYIESGFDSSLKNS